MLGNQISLTNNVAKQVISVTATQDQTDFTVEGGYRINQLGVYRNGVRQVDGRDYIARNGATVTLLSQGANAGDAMEFVVFDDFRVADALSVNTGGTVNASVNITGALQMGTGTSIFSPANNVLTLGTNDSERVRIASDGSVGIGTDNPAGKLHLSSGESGDCVLILESDTDNNNENDNSYIEFRQDGGISASAIGMNMYNTNDENNSLILSNSLTPHAGIIFKTGTGIGHTLAEERLRITSGGSVGIETTNPQAKLQVAGSSMFGPEGTGQYQGIQLLNGRDSSANLSTGFIDFRNNLNIPDAHMFVDHQTDGGSTIIFGTTPIGDRTSDRRAERLRITSKGEVLIGTTVANSFNGVGEAHVLVATGSTSSTNILNNSSAAITISNKDGTADNTAGLHFAREDNDGTPHYSGASVVTQFKEAQVTGQYPKADLAFLTSTAANNAPSEKMRIFASGAVTKTANPLLKTNMGNVYGSAGSLHGSPSVAILQSAAEIDKGDNSWSTSGTNAYTFVCPVAGVYAVHAHFSLDDITQGARVIWSMVYTDGGGNLPLSSYVEVMDTNVHDYQNYSYFNTFNFSAGTRVGFGINDGGSGGTKSGLNSQWGIYLLQ